jgi:hypothetical protein
MEQLPRRPGGDDEQPLPGEALVPVEVEPGQARKIIEDGITAAEAVGQRVEDWVAWHIALQLKDEDDSGLDVLAQSGEIIEDLQPELMRAYLKQLPQRRWIDALYGYATERTDHGPVEGWAERAHVRDQFHAAWWNRDGQRGNRYLEGRELDREIGLAQGSRQAIGDELALRLLVRIAPNPHSGVARFAADGQVTDELSRELQELYLSGTEQDRRWLNELGSWIAARGGQSPVPWWRSSAQVEQAVTEQADPTEQAERRTARLADLDERLAPLPDLGDIPRPPTGHGFGGGYEWMEEALPEGWYVEPMWGRDGWNLGSWPYVVVALYIDDEHERYAVTTYVEGDINVRRYKSRGALYVAVNGIAEFHWRLGQSRGPRDLPEESGLLPYHTGPYSPWRSARDADVQGRQRRLRETGD